LRRAIRAGELRAFNFGTKRPRITWADFLEWVRSTRVVPTSEHAEQRAAEILEHERRSAGGPRAN